MKSEATAESMCPFHKGLADAGIPLGERFSAAGGAVKPGQESVDTQEIAGPSGMDTIKKIPALTETPIEYFNSLHQQYGEIFKLPLFGSNIIVTKNADHIHHILRNNYENYDKAKRLEGQTKHIYGEEWTNAANRKLVKPFFHSRRYPEMVDTVNSDIEKILSKFDAYAKQEKVVDIAAEMLDLSWVFTSNTMIGTDFSENDGEVKAAFKVIVDNLSKQMTSVMPIPKWIPTPNNIKVNEATALVYTALTKIISERRNQSTDKEGDLLDIMADAVYELSGQKLDDELLRKRLLWMLLPSAEPIGRTLSWLWFALAREPECVQRICSELDEVLGGRKPTYDDISALEYTSQVVMETMRLYPPFWCITRQAIAADNVCGNKISPNDLIFFNVLGVHTNPRYWENPMRFNPDNFTKEKIRARPATAYLPFSNGNRMCQGGPIAQIQMTLVVANILQRFAIQVLDKEDVPYVAGVTLMPKNGIRAKVFQRVSRADCATRNG